MWKGWEHKEVRPIDRYVPRWGKKTLVEEREQGRTGVRKLASKKEKSPLVTKTKTQEETKWSWRGYRMPPGVM